jgi:hypothetical protein
VLSALGGGLCGWGFVVRVRGRGDGRLLAFGGGGLAGRSLGLLSDSGARSGGDGASSGNDGLAVLADFGKVLGESFSGGRGAE